MGGIIDKVELDDNIMDKVEMIYAVMDCFKADGVVFDRKQLVLK